MFSAPEIITTPRYINIFPMYKGLRVCAYGPVQQSEGAPTFLVLVIPPAQLTDIIRMTSPMNKIKKPTEIDFNLGSELYKTNNTIGMGVQLLYEKKKFLIDTILNLS